MPNEKLKINVTKKTVFALKYVIALVCTFKSHLGCFFFMLVSHMDSGGGNQTEWHEMVTPDASWLCSDQMDAIVKDWQETKVKAYCASFIVKEQSLI